MKKGLTATAMGAVLVLAAGRVWAEAPYDVAWVRQFGTPADEIAYSVAVDGQGNSYISGYTEGSLGGPYLGAGYLREQV